MVLEVKVLPEVFGAKGYPQDGPGPLGKAYVPGKLRNLTANQLQYQLPMIKSKVLLGTIKRQQSQVMRRTSALHFYFVRV